VFAIVTPFNERDGIDEPALRDYLRLLDEKGVPAIVAGGTTGEFPSLTPAERMRLLECCRRDFRGTVVAHASSCCVGDCRQLLDHAREHADAVLLLPPFYYARPSGEGVHQFLGAAIAHSRLPVYLYNFPEHTQFAITPQLLAELAAQHPMLAGIKDSGGDFNVSRAYKAACPQLQVFVGSDRRALEVLESGLDGSVTGAGNPVPEAFVAIARGYESGNQERARAGQRLLDRWTDFRERVPGGDIRISKAALGDRVAGFPARVRPPLVTCDEQQIARIRAGLRECL
jgi:4-hydroxy-tetrahydrodipicolinate synthase